MEKFVEILEDLIENTGKNLYTIGKESGVSATQYSRYLNGSIPSLLVAVKIANYFECTLDYLFGVESKNYYSGAKEIDLNGFVERYLEVLNKNHTSHYKLCKKSDLSESNIRHWKNGDIPSMQSLILIADALPVKIDYLIGRK